MNSCGCVVRSRCSCMPVSVFLIAVLASSAQAQIPVEGDEQLLEVVREAQLSQRKSLLKGRLKAIVKKFEWSATLSYVWQDERSRIDFVLISPAVSENSSPRRDNGVAIIAGREMFIYYPTLTLAQTVENFSKRPQPPLDWHPQTTWYSCDLVFPWEKLLDHKNPLGKIKRFTVDESTPGQVKITRWYESGPRLEIVAAKDLGFNIVSYEEKGLAKGQNGNAGDATWVADGAGGFYPQRMRYWQFTADVDESPREVFKMEITEFSRDIEGRENLLNIDSVPLPPGILEDRVDSTGKTTMSQVVGGDAGLKLRRIWFTEQEEQRTLASEGQSDGKQE